MLQELRIVFCCHSVPVIINGSTARSYEEGNSYKRTVIGSVNNDSCEYYIVTDQTYNNKLSNTAEYLLEKGCTDATSLDQGGSVSLVYKGVLLNTPSDGVERSVGDFLCFYS